MPMPIPNENFELKMTSRSIYLTIGLEHFLYQRIVSGRQHTHEGGQTATAIYRVSPYYTTQQVPIAVILNESCSSLAKRTNQNGASYYLC